MNLTSAVLSQYTRGRRRATYQSSNSFIVTIQILPNTHRVSWLIYRISWGVSNVIPIRRLTNEHVISTECGAFCVVCHRDYQDITVFPDSSAGVLWMYRMQMTFEDCELFRVVYVSTGFVYATWCRHKLVLLLVFVCVLNTDYRSTVWHISHDTTSKRKRKVVSIV